MTKENKEKEEELQAQNLDASEEGKALSTKKHKKNYLLFFLILALLLSGAFGAAYFFAPSVLSKITLPDLPDLTLESQEIVQPSQPKEVNLPINPTQYEEVLLEEEPETIFEEESNVLEEEPEETLITPPEVSQEPAIFEPELNTPDERDLSLFQIGEQDTVVVTTQQPHRYDFSVLKAIQLRDALKQGEECRPLLEELMALPNKSPEMEKALIDLLQACLDRPLSGQMQAAFKKAKKRAILRIFQNDNPTYLAYLKAIPYFVADVRYKTPTGNSPMDILNRLQEAVNSDRPQLVLKLIPELPANVQSTLYDVQQYATHEADLYHSFNKIMRVLFAEGGSND